MRLRGYAAGLVSLVCAAAVAGCERQKIVGAADRGPQTAKVTRRDIVAQIPVEGALALPPSARAQIRPGIKAPVDRVLKSVGSSVREGEALVVLSLPTAEAYHEQAKAALQEAERAYANAEREQKALLKPLEDRLKAAREAEQAARKVSQGIMPQNPTVDLATSLDEAVQKRQEAEAALLQARADMHEALIPYRRSLEQARAAERAARAGERQGEVRTPISGIVLALNAQPGKMPPENAPIAEVANLDQLHVQATLTTAQAAEIKPGMEVSLRFAELPLKEFTGRISRITSRPDRNDYIAIVEFENKDLAVRPGMTVQAAVRTGQTARDALAVPAGAVQHDNDARPFVEVLRGEKWEKVVVEVGVTDGQFTQIRSGLNEGDTVKVVS